jgi:multidrug efflux pump subunit AcrB
MRIWLKPDRMAKLGVTTTDIAAAIRVQNAQNAAGKIGQEPAPGPAAGLHGHRQGPPAEPEEFGNIVLRASGPNGVLRLKDVARIELGATATTSQRARWTATHHRHGRLPAIRRQRAGSGRAGARQDGRAEEENSRRAWIT